jgi:hypothetical protein
MLSFMMVSADGYHADPGQDLGWQTVDQEFSQFALAQLREAGTLVFGRVTYELMAAFWPTRAGEESDPDVAKGDEHHSQDRHLADAGAGHLGGHAVRQQPRRRGTGCHQGYPPERHRRSD